MLYLEQRQELIYRIEGLKENQLIDRGGGSLSMRCPDGNILFTVTGEQFNGWKIGENDFIVLDPEGNIVERTSKLGPAGTPVHLALYQLFPECNTVFHTHAQYSLVFASLNRSIPSTTYQMDVLGDVPCLFSDDNAIKAQLSQDPYPIQVPEGMVQKPILVAIANQIIPQIETQFLPRRAELKRHGLGFTTLRHGLYVFARHTEEAADNLYRIETSARTAIWGAQLQGEPLQNRLSAMSGF